MKKSKKILSVLTAFSIVFTTATAIYQNNLVVFAYNDTTAVNTDQYQSEAVEVTYEGAQTLVYGVQAYAGISGPVWVTDEKAAILEDGTDSHSLGSNASDGRSNLKVTFKINSLAEGNAYLGVFVKNDHDNSHATVKVNDQDSFSINFKDLTQADFVQTAAAMIPVYLQSGSNLIEITMQENYTAWFGSFFVSNVAEYVSHLEYNETSTYNATAPETEAVTINYDGLSTKVYGIQSYAGMSGPAWIVADKAEILEDGSEAHSLGSNASDGRSHFTMTFSINSTVTEDAYLNVYAKIDSAETSNAVLNVNGSEENINFYTLNNVTWNQSIPTKIKVSLVSGLNTISITLQENYTLWVGSWSVTPYNAEPTYYDYSKITIGMYTEKTGDMSAGGDFVGLNAFDDAADYGKTGTVTYQFTCEEAGEYYLKLTVQAGNDLANRATLTINEQLYVSNDKPYISFDTKAGWAGDSLNTYKISLREGLNTLVIGNYLTSVNESKTQEVESGSENSVLVSNWWMHQLSIEAIPDMELFVDTTSAQTIYNIGRSYTSEGLKVTYKEDDVSTVLNDDEYIIDSSAYNANLFGTYPIYIIKKDNPDVRTSYLTTVGDNGQPYAGKVVSYAGNTTGQVYSFYNYAMIEGEGTDECEGRIFWYNTNKILPDGGFEFGSNGSGVNENRQVTLTLRIDSAVAGDYALISEITTNDRNNAIMTIQVNDEQAYDACLFYASENLPYRFVVSLKEGENIIKLTSKNQYNFWFRNFGLAPIESKNVGESFAAKEGYRYGMSLIDADENDLYKTTTADGSLEFYYQVTENGNYVLNLNTIAVGEKKCDVYIDDVCYDTTIINGVSKVYFSLTEGLHRISVKTTSGTESDFALSSILLSKDIRPEKLLINTDNSQLTIPYDGILDTTTIKVSMQYNDGSISELAKSEFSIIKDENFASDKPGTYTFTVVYKENEEISATFTVVVQEKPQDPSDNSSQPSEEPSPDDSSTITTPSNPKGCKGDIAASGISVLLLAGIAILLRKRKEQ